jgi:outer membrane cobalamin receptor
MSRAIPPHLLLRSALLTLCLSAAGIAHAEPKDDARRYFTQGLEAATRKDYQGALDAFLAAQNAYPHPATLHNIARSYTDLGDLPQAIAYYRLYSDAAPEKAEDTAPIIAVLEARLRQKQAPVRPAVVPVAPVAPETVGDLPDGTATGVAATSGDAARLQAIAAELAALSARLGGGGVAVPSADPTPPQDGTADIEEDVTPAPLPDQGELLSGAYERVVVTASRYGQSPLEAPTSVTILSEDDIRQSGATNIPDLLRRVVGVDVMSLASSQPDVSIRGFNRELSNKVLVLIDGRSVYNDLLGSTFWATLPISLLEIERVEIIRGPGSAVYGANAVTGVINLITRPPGEGTNLLSLGAGTTDYGHGVAVTSGRHEQTAWRAAGEYDQIGRWARASDPDTETALMPFLEDQDRAMEVVRASGRVDRKFLDDGLFSVSGGYASGFTEFYVFGALGDFAMDFESTFARMDLSYKGVHLRAFRNSLSGTAAPWTENVGQRSLEQTLDNVTQDVELEVDRSFETGTVAHRLNAGVGYRHKQVAWNFLQNNAEPIGEDHLSGFVSEQAQLAAVTLVGSLRVDRHPLVDLEDTIAPRGAIVVRAAPSTAIRASVGTSYRTPTFIEAYSDFDQETPVDGIYVRTLGGVDRPERILTGEVGVHDSSSRFHEADAAAYVNRVRDLIYLRDVETGIATLDADNVGFEAGSTGFTNLDAVYTGYGIELDGRLFPADGLDVLMNADLQRIIEDDNGVVVEDGSTSAVKLNGGLVYRLPFRTDVSGFVHWVSAQDWRLREFDSNGQLQVQTESIPARTLVSARLALRPLPDDSLEIAISAWNIGALVSGGANYREHPKGQPVGSVATGSLSWRF